VFVILQQLSRIFDPGGTKAMLAGKLRGSPPNVTHPQEGGLQKRIGFGPCKGKIPILFCLKGLSILFTCKRGCILRYNMGMN